MTRLPPWPVLSELPVPEVVELEGRDAFEALVQHFDHPDEATVPMGLDLVPTEESRFAEQLRRAGLALDLDVTDRWEAAR